MLKIPAPSRANAIRFPSGENAGASAGYAPFVSCLRPLPDRVDPEDLLDPEPGWIGGEHEPLRLSRNADDRCGCPEAAETTVRTTAVTTTSRPAHKTRSRRCFVDRSDAASHFVTLHFMQRPSAARLRTVVRGALLWFAPSLSLALVRRRRGHTKLASLLVVCALVAGGVIAALIITSGRRAQTPRVLAPTTGDWTPITVTRPKIPVIAGGIPVDIDPSVSRTDFSTTLFPLGPRRYRMTVFNTSNLGAINSFQWYPPTGVRVVKVIGSSEGNCTLTGLTGFGGNQFPTIVLYPNIFCDNLDLKPATCICRGDGGAVSISFVTTSPSRSTKVN